MLFRSCKRNCQGRKYGRKSNRGYTVDKEGGKGREIIIVNDKEEIVEPERGREGVYCRKRNTKKRKR